MAAKLDQTAESICGPKWAIARDLSVYDGANAATSKGKTVSADRGPPMVRIYRAYILKFIEILPIRRAGLASPFWS